MAAVFELVITANRFNIVAVNPYQLEKTRVIEGFSRAAANYEKCAVLAREVRKRLLDRLDYLSIEPAVVIDMGAATGAGAQTLGQRYPESGVFALDFVPAMIDRINREDARIQPLCADAAEVPLPDQCAELIFSNLMLPWCDDLDAVLGEFRRLISPQGAVTFSTFGPDTLVELRRAWREVDDYEHVHAFFDMHDIGDALMRAGFAEPVMDVERITLTYADVTALLQDLRAMGSINALSNRRRGLVANDYAKRLEKQYEVFRENDRLPATFEVIYGQAWGPVAGQGIRAGDGTTRFPIDQIGRRRDE